MVKEDYYNNTGFIELGPDRSDYLGGTIPFEVRIKTGNWDEYLPTLELQKKGSFDTMGCVSFSANNSIEVQLNWMIKNSIIKQTDECFIFLKENGYFDKQGNINLSDRFLARVSETTPNGNSMKRVADALRYYGAVPEYKWPFPEGMVRSEYYKDVPKDLKKLGKQFKQYFETQYEWIGRNDIFKQMQHAPIQFATAICWGWKSDKLIKACDQPIIHAYIGYGYEDKKLIKIFDHYLDSGNDVMKILAWDFKIPFALKIVLLKKNQNFSDPKVALELNRNLRRFQIILVPDANGEMYLADCSLGKSSWKFHINEFGLAQQLAKSKIAHGVSKTKASKIRTIDSLEEVAHLYR